MRILVRLGPTRLAPPSSARPRPFARRAQLFHSQRRRRERVLRGGGKGRRTRSIAPPNLQPRRQQQLLGGGGSGGRMARTAANIEITSLPPPPARSPAPSRTWQCRRCGGQSTVRFVTSRAANRGKGVGLPVCVCSTYRRVVSDVGGRRRRRRPSAPAGWPLTEDLSLTHTHTA